MTPGELPEKAAVFGYPKNTMSCFNAGKPILNINSYKEAPMEPIFEHVLYYKQGTPPESRLKRFIAPEELPV